MDDIDFAECDETPATFWAEEAYLAGVGSALTGVSLNDAIREAESSGAPFGEDEREALRTGWWDGVRFQRDMRDANDSPRAA